VADARAAGEEHQRGEQRDEQRRREVRLQHHRHQHRAPDHQEGQQPLAQRVERSCFFTASAAVQTISASFANSDGWKLIPRSAASGGRR
jgi:hypothetical protein